MLPKIQMIRLHILQESEMTDSDRFHKMLHRMCWRTLGPELPEGGGGTLAPAMFSLSPKYHSMVFKNVSRVLKPYEMICHGYGPTTVFKLIGRIV